MKQLTAIILMLLSFPINSQNWAGIGSFNWGPATFFNDTLADEIYIGGSFTFYNNDTMVGIAKWNGHTMTTLGCGIEWDCITTGISGYTPPVLSIIRYNNYIYLTGAFDKAGNTTVNGITRWNGTDWDNFGTGLKCKDGSFGLGGNLKIIDNELFVVGIFDSVAGIAANGLAKFNGTIWSNVNNFPMISNTPGDIDFIYDVEEFKNELYVCGKFYNTSTNIYNIVKWDGANWISVGNGIRGSITDVNNMLIYNDKLIVAGRFSKSVYANNPGENIGAWDGSQWNELGTGTDDKIWNMRVHKDTLYVVGAFTHAGNIPAGGIARWDGEKWCGYGTIFNNVVKELDYYHDTLYIGGSYWTINGDSINNFAKWIGGNYIDTCGNATAIENINTVNTSISIYPNPTTTQITIEFALQEGQNVLVEIRNVLGKTVKSEERRVKSEKMVVDVSGMAPGIYMIQTFDNSGIQYSSKFIKQ